MGTGEQSEQRRGERGRKKGRINKGRVLELEWEAKK